MVTVQTPHFSYPFRFTGKDFAVIEQDSYNEIAQSVQIVLSTPTGSRMEVPTFGIEDPVFTLDSASRSDQMIDALKLWEKRAEFNLNITIDNIEEFVHRIHVDLQDVPDNDMTSALPEFVEPPPVMGDDDAFGEGGFGTGMFGE